MDELQELKLRVANLEKSIIAMGQVSTAEITSNQSSEAMAEALFSLVKDLAMHEGMSELEFLGHYDKRFQYYYARCLQRVEDISPSLAAEIDTRAISESATGESFPPLFGGTNEANS